MSSSAPVRTVRSVDTPHLDATTELLDDLREATATFGEAEATDGWENQRRELATFYAVHKRRPRRRAFQSSERRLAVWVRAQERAHHLHESDSQRMLLALTPGWRVPASVDPGPRNRRSTYRVSA